MISNNDATTELRNRFIIKKRLEVIFEAVISMGNQMVNGEIIS